ncbi:phage tail protein [Marinomonas transparens]|uniref:Phage tail protein n=1 Tax=Marinomonas transparens TaxID=2795388 RepID=A0A934JJJ0_9GAMM|nr:phage tail protein [Marinomonas transparens]MBJ7536956.1 phage tail protein [Marinomonas transparens]
MKKMIALRAYLEGLNFCHKKEKFDAWVEDMEQTTRGKYEGNRVLLYRSKYRAVFSIEGFVYSKEPIELLHTRLITWLADNDERGDMEDKELSISPDILDDDTADIEITLMFEEDVYIAEVEDGPIEYAGKTWELADPEHDIAESFDLINQNE